jgi:hypothetical protein
MNHAFFVTSSIELDPTRNFKGTKKRTVFSTNERLVQTIKTITNLREKDPIAPIYLIDSSARTFDQLNCIGVKNLHYIKLQELNPAVADIVRTHSSKSYCECLMILEFFKHYKKELQKYNFVTKICARYTLSDNYNTDLFTPENIDKFFMKKELMWDNEHINFLTEVQLPRDLLVDNKLYGFYTVAHAMGNQKIDQYEAIMAASAQMATEHGKYYHQDVEYTLHLYLRLFGLLNDVIIVDWTVDGRCGVTGDWVRY